MVKTIVHASMSKKLGVQIPQYTKKCQVDCDFPSVTTALRSADRVSSKQAD